MSLEKTVDSTTNESMMDEIGSMTIHGVSKIFTSSSRLFQALWAILCLAAFGFLVFCASKSISIHFKYEVYTKEDVQRETEMDLPAITICNTNILDNEAYKVEENLPKNCSFTAKEYFKNEVSRDYFIKACHWFSGFHPINEGAVARVGQYKINTFRFPQHFTFLPSFWPCFTLNRNQTLKQDIAGIRGGLRMILSFDENEYGIGPYNTILDDERRGLSVAVHDPQEHVPKINYIPLPTGFHTIIEIKKSTINRMPSPFPSQCVDYKQKERENIFTGKKTIHSCFLSCFAIKGYNKCGGVLPGFRPFMSPEKYPKSFNISGGNPYSCAKIVITDMNQCDCPIPCEEEIYETKVSRISWPQEWQKAALHRLLFRNETYDENAAKSITKRSLKLTVYYSDLYEYRYTEEEKYGLSSVVADFGGQMGLFIGASILSFVEVFIILGKFIKSFISSKRMSPSIETSERENTPSMVKMG